MKLRLIIVSILVILNSAFISFRGIDGEEIQKQNTMCKYESLTKISKYDYNKIIEDGNINEIEARDLYEDYYTKSPNKFLASATYYGSDEMSYYETSFYGEVMRQQMSRGWVLIGSGKFGFHNNAKDELEKFISINYPFLSNDVLLSKQASPMYYYFADGGVNRENRDKRNQPIPVSYDELNPEQKRLFDITSVPYYDIEDKFIDKEQYKLSEEEALASGKYASIVSAKSPNDLGRAFLIYKLDKYGNYEFYGVVLVAGVAKRADWIGMESTSNDYFRWYNYPLITRYTNGQHWGFDFPETIYKWFGGDGGPVYNIMAVDVNCYLTNSQT